MTWILLAKIINEVPYSISTTIFNKKLERMVKKRIEEGDKVKIVDMEKDAGLIYKIDTVAPYKNGDMYDKLHPNKRGYEKMAYLFFDTLSVLINKISPIEFEGLTYYDNMKSRVLFWQTSMELNISGFEVQRFSGENKWDNLGFIKGNENSHHLQTYYFIDSAITLNHSNKNNIYRLKQIENNGNSKSLAELNIGKKKIEQAKFYPNQVPIVQLTSYDKSDESCVHCKGIQLEFQRSSSYNFYHINNKSKLIKRKKTLASELFYYILNIISIDSKVMFSLT